MVGLGTGELGEISLEGLFHGKTDVYSGWLRLLLFRNYKPFKATSPSSMGSLPHAPKTDYWPGIVSTNHSVWMGSQYVSGRAATSAISPQQMWGTLSCICIFRTYVRQHKCKQLNLKRFHQRKRNTWSSGVLLQQTWGNLSACKNTAVVRFRQKYVMFALRCK